MPSAKLSWGALGRQRRGARERRRALVGYLCISPWLIGFIVFTLIPIVLSAYYSLTNYSILGSPSYIGLQNYRLLLHDPLFWQSLRVTGIYCLAVVPGTMFVGYTLALLLNKKVRGMRAWRSIYFLPSVMPAIASAYLWTWMFNPNYGFVNSALSHLGIKGPQWFASTTWVLPAFILLALWGSGAGLVLYLAALQQVPNDLYEASEIDGANAFRRLIHVTIPITSPVILFTFVTGIITSFQVFTAGFAITEGGPDNASLFYILYLYQNGWQYFKMGYASALAWVLLLLTLLVTGLALIVARRFVYYESAAR